MKARDEIQRLCPGGVDAFIDNTGNPDVIGMGYELTKPAGRVVLVGVPAKGRNVSLYSLPLHFGKELRGSHGGDAVPQTDIPRYAALYGAGRIKLKELVTERFPLSEINTAIERMRDGRLAGRCSIRMDAG
jgi:Zn-dependent alcohol dehydrogenase